MAKWGMVIDLDKCVGCQACVVACKEENNVPHGSPEEQHSRREIFWHKMIAVTRGKYPPCSDRSHPMPCMQCETSALRHGLSGKGHLSTGGRDRCPVFPEMHRLQVLHGGLPLRGKELQLQDAGGKALSSSGPASGSHVLGTLAFSHPDAGRGGKMHVLFPPDRPGAQGRKEESG